MTLLIRSKIDKAILFNPSDHPRAAAGTMGLYRGGQFVPSGQQELGAQDQGQEMAQPTPMPETGFRWFQKPVPADQWAMTRFHAYGSELDGNDVAALSLYQTPVHVALNRFLRRSDPRYGDGTVRDLVQALDVAISKGFTQEPAVFWRNIHSPHLNQHYDKLRGRFISDRGFASANIDADTAMLRASDNPEHILCQIRLPRYFPVAFADAAHSVGMKEMVLPRNLVYQVQSADVNRGGMRHMVLEVVGIGDPKTPAPLNKSLDSDLHYHHENRFVWRHGEVDVTPPLPKPRPTRGYLG